MSTHCSVCNQPKTRDHNCTLDGKPKEIRNVNRVEVIDHTKTYEDGGGRAYTFHEKGVVISTSLQDNGKTLKVFINKGT